jgi:hypothetical protein
MIAVALSVPALARAQSGAPVTEEEMVIPLHPSTPTTLQFPDEIVDARILHRGEFWMEIVGQSINLRPRPGIPAGTEAVVIVETSSVRRRFLVHVVERPEDAVRKLVLAGVKTREHTEAAQQAEAPPVAPAAPEPTASGPASTPAPPAPAAPQPQADNEPAPEPARESAEPAPERAIKAAAAARAFDLSVHALVSLGYTALDVPGYAPSNARQPHGALGLRLTLAPQEAIWALEASVSGQRLAGPLKYSSGDSHLEIRGSWLHAELGIAARRGRRWIPTFYARAGLQTHLRRTKELDISDETKSVETLYRGAVLTLGMGLHYRARAVSLGLEFQVRQGWPDDYLSIAAVWDVGRFLDQGE